MFAVCLFLFFSIIIAYRDNGQCDFNRRVIPPCFCIERRVQRICMDGNTSARISFSSSCDVSHSSSRLSSIMQSGAAVFGKFI